MIDPDKRRAIFALHEAGMKIWEIVRRLGVSRNAVRAIIQQAGVVPDTIRKDKTEIDPELLRRLHRECEGRVQRVHEKLSEEEGIQVGYSTLTRMMRELGIGHPAGKRCGRVPDEPGAEMQHDTSPYKLKIGEKRLPVVGSLIYFRYSKRRYLKFYRAFNRFKMKCFFHEALSFFGYAAPVCIIDNTSLARLRGTGRNAVIVPEMERFAGRYRFEFVCHEKGHTNRKAGNERSFFTVETNFFPGRSFESLEDLNRQALEWATVRMANRPVSKTGLIPAKAFEHEKSYLNRLAPFVDPPYLVHKRGTDQYGYAAFDGNYYWVPGTSRREVTVLEYGECLKIFQGRKMLAEYPLPPHGVKNQPFRPEGMLEPGWNPRNRKKPTAQEEKKLRAIAEEVDAYLEFALKPKGIQRHRFILELFRLQQKIAPPLFIRTVRRALKYRITDMGTVERIALLYISNGNHETPCVKIDESFQDREAYREGRLSEDVDLSIYDRMLEDNDG